MKSIDYVTALGRLLSSPALQALYEDNPQNLADVLNLNDADRCLFVNLSTQQVHTQAKLLINKRLREVSKLLPLTCHSLGMRLSDLFSTYAASYWPDSHRRHLHDAYFFCRYLKSHNDELNQSEFNKIRFLYHRHSLKLYFTRDALVREKAYPAIQLFYRTRQHYSEWRFFLKI